MRVPIIKMGTKPQIVTGVTVWLEVQFDLCFDQMREQNPKKQCSRIKVIGVNRYDIACLHKPECNPVGLQCRVFGHKLCHHHFWQVNIFCWDLLHEQKVWWLLIGVQTG